ncbi:MAG TPA: ATP-binding protein [Actinomycetota bacterium]|jgi:heavy metal sensor kinase|nr:ATP-binding protein [Actinomycetota bacterium]
MGLRIRTRLTLASAGLVAVILVAAGVFVYVQFEADLRETVDLGLRSRADALLSSGDPSLSSAGLIEADEAFAQILSADGDVLESTPGVAAAIRAGEVRVARFEDTSARTVEEVVPARVLLVPLDDGRVLLVGASVEDQEEALARLAALLLIGGPAALALVVIVVWLIVGAALRPVEAMRSEAAAISASEPDRRLPVGQTDDELARLGRTLNEMLERLQRALERERRFVDDASHELRTPLANLKAELDLSIRRARTPDELEVALRSAAEETDRLVRLAEDLLVLARAKGGKLPVRREQVDAAALVRDIVATFEGRASERGVTLDDEAEDGVRADVDPLRMRQAIGNLIDNALRHAPPGGRVSVALARANGELTISVSDSGPGFPPEFLADAFEPFTRDDAARSRSDGGTGLGLAIVRAIAEAHGGSAEARNTARGAEVVLRFPA